MIRVEGLSKHYAMPLGLVDSIRGRAPRCLRAVDGVSLDVAAGKVTGVVGESGCGKSTLARLLVGLEPPTHGEIYMGEENARALKEMDRRRFHRRVQMVFQDPYGSMNPQQRILDIVQRPMYYQRSGIGAEDMRRRAILALEDAGLTPASDYLEKFPHQLSGGQRQRVCIARAIVLEPQILIADEPISMLDVSIKWGIIQLLKRLVRERNLAMIYITHDLSSAESVCDDLAVMYLGRVVEHGPIEAIVSAPQHPYTRALLAATPSIDPSLRHKAPAISGSIPNALALPSGCRFHPRCPMAAPVCASDEPGELAQGDHRVACHFAFDGAPLAEPSS